MQKETQRTTSYKQTDYQLYNKSTRENFDKLVNKDNRVTLVLEVPLYDLFGDIDEVNDLVDEFMPEGVILCDISYTAVGVNREENKVHLEVEGLVENSEL